MDRRKASLCLWDAFHEAVSVGCEAERFADRIEARATHPDRCAMVLTKEDQDALRRLESRVGEIEDRLPLEEIAQHMPDVRAELIYIELDTLQAYLEGREREHRGEIAYRAAYRRALEIQRSIIALLQNAAAVVRQWSEERDAGA